MSNANAQVMGRVCWKDSEPCPRVICRTTRGVTYTECRAIETCVLAVPCTDEYPPDWDDSYERGDG